MKFYALCFFFACVSAAPQGATFESDAEVVPSAGRSPVGSAGGDGGFLDIPVITVFRSRPSRPRTNIFDVLFGNGGDDTTTTTTSQDGFLPDIFGGLPSRFPSFGGFFPSIFGGESGADAGPGFPSVFDVPDFSDVPGAYDNSTYEVNDVNGTRVEVNRTVTRNEDGSFVFTKVFVKFTPEDEDGSVDTETAGTGTDTVSGGETGSPAVPPPPPEVPAEVVDPSVNQEATLPSLVRRKRLSIPDWLKAFLFPKVSASAVASPLSSLPAPRPDDDSAETANNLDNRVPLIVPRPSHSLEGDTDVNYSGPFLRNNPDAEIFDENLVRADLDRFFGRRERPFAEPLRSEPIMHG